MLEIRRPWRQNPDRTDLDLKLELPERIARASCSRNARGARPARAQDPIQFRSGTKQEGPIRTEAKRTDNGRTETRRTRGTFQDTCIGRWAVAVKKISMVKAPCRGSAALRCAVLQSASRNTTRNSPRNALRSIPRDTPGNSQRNTLRNTSRNAPTNHPNETPCETPHETPSLTFYESAQEIQ